MKKKQAKEPSVKRKFRDDLEEKLRLQTDELKIRDGQIKQGADREKQGADREKLGAYREKIAEEQIHIRTKAMEATFDGIFIIDAQKPDFPIIYANPSFYTLTGYSRSEVIEEIISCSMGWMIIRESMKK